MNTNTNSNTQRSLITLASGLGMLTLLCVNTQAAPLSEAIVMGTAKVDLRLRAEMVEQEGLDKSANAVTARTRIGYQGGEYKGLSGLFEFENITALVDEYAYPGVNIGTYPVVADPAGTEVNQAYLSYTRKDWVAIMAGRQRIILDGARFVGNVGWRQNEQTYDAARLSIKAISNASIDYAYLGQVNNIFGDSAELKAHLANASYTLAGNKLAAYGYFLDMATGSDSATMGLSFDGKLALGESKLLYRAEYASMGDYADNTSGASNSYLNIELGAMMMGLTAKAGYEVLAGDGQSAFQTPLATKHKFNGWADKFLLTPADGLTDTYFSVMAKPAGVKLLAVYHLYGADASSDTYGSELNLLAAKKFAKHYSAGVKYANYMADTLSVDTSKLWLWFGVAF